MSASVLAVDADLGEAALSALLTEPAAALAAGQLVAFPTETVYGLGADALSAEAAGRIFTAKRRPADNPLIVHLPDADWLPRVALPTPLGRELAGRFWPGPLTLVLQRTDAVPDIVTAGGDTVAVRVPDSAVARTLIRLAGTPVAAPSANVSGRPSPTTADHVAADLATDVAWVVDAGPCRVGIESTVVDARGATPVVLREGAVTREMLGTVEVSGGRSAAPSPGTRHRHYQPEAQVRVAPPGRGVAVANQAVRSGRRVGLVAALVEGVDQRVVVVGTPADAEALARDLYACLRRADELALDEVVVESVSETGVGRAVMDRLRRAGGTR